MNHLFNDDMSEETKRSVVHTELERVLRKMAAEIRELKRRVGALEGKNEAINL